MFGGEQLQQPRSPRDAEPCQHIRAFADTHVLNPDLWLAIRRPNNNNTPDGKEDGDIPVEDILFLKNPLDDPASLKRGLMRQTDVEDPKMYIYITATSAGLEKEPPGSTAAPSPREENNLLKHCWGKTIMFPGT